MIAGEQFTDFVDAAAKEVSEHFQASLGAVPFPSHTATIASDTAGITGGANET
jgi:hypothetical protein